MRKLVHSVPAIALGLLASTALVAPPAHAIGVSPTSDAFGLANTLFLNFGPLLVTDADLSGEFGQAGTYTNASGTYGLPNSGIVLSTGNVANYADGPNFNSGQSGNFDTEASSDQQDLLGPITGKSEHFDVVQLDISFHVNADIDQISFFGAFGSEEYPEWVNSTYNDGFGLFVNGQNVAGVQPSFGGPNLPVNIDHPDMTAMAGTELDGILAPNGNPVLRFDVPVNAGEVNQFTVILADAGDSSLDTTVYLSSFVAQGIPGDTGGTTEFNPILPANPQDPITGAYVIELPVLPAGETVWIDPPVAVGYQYDISGGLLATVTAPSLATVADPDGYFVTVDGITVALAAGATLDFSDAFGVNPDSFTLTGIDPALALLPGDPAAFPIGLSFTTALATGGSVTMTPLTENIGAVPLPASGLLLMGGLAALGLLRRKRAAA